VTATIDNATKLTRFTQMKLHNEQQCNVVSTNGSVDSDL